MSVDEVVTGPAETRPGAQRLAAWLAAVSALVMFGVVVFMAVTSGRGPADVPPVWLALGPLVAGVAVPVGGAWLVTRREPLRGAVGLAVVATWGLLTLPNVLGSVARVVASTSLRPILHPLAAPEVLAVLALVAAVAALRGRASPARVHAPGARRLAAAGLVVWGLVTLVVSGVTAAALPPVMSGGGQAGAYGPGGAERAVMVLASPAATVLVLVGISVMVWRRDSLLVSSGVFVAAVHQVVLGLIGAVSTLRFGPAPFFGPSLSESITVAGLDVAILVPVITIVGAVVLVTATGPLAAAARRAWWFR